MTQPDPAIERLQSFMTACVAAPNIIIDIFPSYPNDPERPHLYTVVLDSGAGELHLECDITDINPEADPLGDHHGTNL